MPSAAVALSRAHVGVATSFALAGFAFASWASRIPDTSVALSLGPRGLGLLLLVGSAGSVLALPLSGWVVSHLGTARTVRYGAILAMGALAVVGLAVSVLHSVAATGAALFGATFGIGSWDVAMNVQGARVEQALGRSIMPRLHAAFSLGTVAGAGVGTVATAARLPIPVHLGLLAVLGLATAVWSVRAYLPDGRSAVTGATGHSVRRSLAAWTERRTLLIGLIVLVAAFAEGTANDWLALAMVTGYGLPTWAGTLALATFLTAMTLGRAIGTVLLDRYGRARVVGVTLAMAATGAGLVWLGPVPVAYAGAALWGVGASLGFPVGMSAAADDPEHAGARVAVVSTIGYLAFLAGPPVVGLVGQHSGVLVAITIVGLAAAPALLLLPSLGAPPQAAPLPEPPRSM